jgi:hypothetical protein
MDLSKGLDIGAVFDKRKMEEARTAFTGLQKAGITTLEQFWSYVIKLNDETGYFSGYILKLISAMYAFNEAIAESEVDELTGKISRLETELSNLKTKFDTTKDAIKASGENLNKLKIERTELTTINTLNEDLRYMTMGLVDASYASKIHNSATRELIDSIRLQREEIDALNQSNQYYALQENKNNLAIMKIQYDAMDHRGRLTRNQQQMINELEKSNMGLRISSLENQNIIDQKTLDLSPLENRLEKTRMWYDEELYITRDTYGKEMKLLDERIALEQKALKNNFKVISGINAAILQNEIDTYNARRALWGKSSKNVTSTNTTNTVSGVNPIIDVFRDIYTGRLPHLQTGIDYVPRTQPYLLHEGERVVSANQNRNKSNSVNIKVEPITIYANVTDNTDIQTLTRRIELAIQSGLINGVTTSYS